MTVGQERFVDDTCTVHQRPPIQLTYPARPRSKPHGRHPIFAAITDAHPDLELVIAWNQPMLRRGKDHVFGVSARSKHLLLGPWGRDTSRILADRLAGDAVNVKTVRVPLDWVVDADLSQAMADVRLAELAG